MRAGGASSTRGGMWRAVVAESSILLAAIRFSGEAKRRAAREMTEDGHSNIACMLSPELLFSFWLSAERAKFLLVSLVGG